MIKNFQENLRFIGFIMTVAAIVGIGSYICELLNVTADIVTIGVGVIGITWALFKLRKIREI